MNRWVLYAWKNGDAVRSSADDEREMDDMKNPNPSNCMEAGFGFFASLCDLALRFPLPPIQIQVERDVLRDKGGHRLHQRGNRPGEKDQQHEHARGEEREHDRRAVEPNRPTTSRSTAP